MECRPNENTIYYLTNTEYKIFENTANSWNRHLLGKFSVQKCIDYLKLLCKNFGFKGYFKNIKTKIVKTNSKLKGTKANFVLVEEIL